MASNHLRCVLVPAVSVYVEAGYQRVKVKIKPGADYAYPKAVCDQFLRLELMADANSAYTLSDVATLQRLDALKLLMIEQPLAADDLVQHAKLQQELKTPLCLDESITGLAAAQTMIQLGSGQIINIKVSRVGDQTNPSPGQDQPARLLVWGDAGVRSCPCSRHCCCIAPRLHPPQ